MPFGCAVSPESLRGQRPVVEDQAVIAARLRILNRRSVEFIGTGIARHGELGLLGWVSCKRLNNAAAGIAVERGQWTTQHLDTRGRGRRKLRCLALAIGQALRKAIHHQPNTAHTKRRARPETSNRDLKILRVVVAIGDVDPRHQAERLADIDLRARRLDPLPIHGIDGARRIKDGLLRAARGHHGLVEPSLCKRHCRHQEKKVHDCGGSWAV